METSSSWKLQCSSYSDWALFLPRRTGWGDWAGMWELGECFQFPKLYHGLQSSTGPISREADLGESWWRGYRERSFSLMNPIKPFTQKPCCCRVLWNIQVLFHTTFTHKTNQSRKPLCHRKDPKSTFSSFSMWAGFQKLKPSSVLLSLRETWSNIWPQMVVCEW